MRVSILTVGSRGDVEPYLALAAGLRRAGHDTVLATHERFRPLVTEHGVRLATLPGDPRETLASPEARRLVGTGRSVVRFARRFLALLEPWFESLAAATAPVVEQADFVLYAPLAFTAWHQAEAAGVRSALATVQPFAPTRAFAAPSLGLTDLGSMGNLASHFLAHQLFWQPLRRRVNAWRTRHLGLDPLPLTGPLSELARRRHPQLYGFSPALVPRPPDWPPRVHVTGAWVFPTEPPFTPSPQLTSFLDHDPVYLGFGSMDDGRAGELSDIVTRLAAVHPLVLGAGWAGLQAAGPRIYPVGELPHRWLFPRVAAVVHHGGAGTTHTAARAGRPQVVVPFFADQPFWGERVAAVGAGPRPIPRRRLTAERLVSAVGLALRPAHRRQAARLGERMGGEDGVARAVRLVEWLAER